MLVYCLKLDQGGFPVAARKGDINPNYITYCRSIISSCKVSAIVQQDAKIHCNQKHLHPFKRSNMKSIYEKDVNLVALSWHKGVGESGDL